MRILILFLVIGLLLTGCVVEEQEYECEMLEDGTFVGDCPIEVMQEMMNTPVLTNTSV